MFEAINKGINDHYDVKGIYPIHMNPLVREAANEIFRDNNRIKIIKHIEVLDFHIFLKTHIILIDSGGIQEEAPQV